MMLKRTVNVLGVIILLFFATTSEAHAYLDPGTGSFIFQMLIAGALGGVLVVKSFWSRITMMVSRVFGKKKKVDDEGPS